LGRSGFVADEREESVATGDFDQDCALGDAGEFDKIFLDESDFA
jgi:hypothetical protein